MPLLDHFHPPLSAERSWRGFHAAWAASIADALNEQLPEQYYAESEAHAGASVEIDVATFDQATPGDGTPRDGGAATTLSPQVWSPPVPALTIPAVFADDVEIRVISTRNGPTLVAAIELISPGNKDRPAARRAFAAKCASYLSQGVSLIIVDVVTGRLANLHNALLRLVETAEPIYLLDEGKLYAVAYRPVRRAGQEEIDFWPTTFAPGDILPTLPLWLSWERCVAVDFEATYLDACQRRRLT
jgi:hypothetical protein